jgi:3-phenylpropionate/trans-cinnamate dioxygenase ferredoxin reductase subunit
VAVLGAQSLAAFEPVAEGGERVAAVRTVSGARLEADLVVVAAGAVPDVMLARGSGLELGELGGVRCDAGLRTSAAGVFAAGDMCEWDSVLHGGPARVEHWDVALEHGRTVARNMLGEDVVHDAVPYFWSDVGDWVTSEYVGVAVDGGWDEEVVRGSMADGRFSVWHLLGGRVVSTLSVGRPDDLDKGRRLIRSREAVDAAALGAGPRD